MRRVAAAAALLLVLAVIAFTIVSLGDDIPRLLGQLALLAVALLAAWVAVTRTGWKRAAGRSLRGHLVSDEHAAEGWTLADAEGHEVDVATMIGRD
jgi:hypothetical protein